MLFALVAPATGAIAQPAETPNAAEIELKLEKLEVMGSALYVGAHPDDEDTALLAALSRGRLVEAAYLSLTRGDGGQNLVGKEKGELIGLLRTQELLAARRIDGARQFFTRAIDFGYSKSPEEALSIWGKEDVLRDTVWLYRKLRPDVVIAGFPTTGEGGHGHHTASAILALEAFRAAGDPTRFPEQLSTVRPWQPKRILWNAFDFETGATPKPKPGWVSLDIAAFNALLGKSYTGDLGDLGHYAQEPGERRGGLPRDVPRRVSAPPGRAAEGGSLRRRRPDVEPRPGRSGGGADSPRGDPRVRASTSRSSRRRISPRIASRRPTSRAGYRSAASPSRTPGIRGTRRRSRVTTPARRRRRAGSSTRATARASSSTRATRSSASFPPACPERSACS